MCGPIIFFFYNLIKCITESYTKWRCLLYSEVFIHFQPFRHVQAISRQFQNKDLDNEIFHRQHLTFSAETEKQTVSLTSLRGLNSCHRVQKSNDLNSSKVETPVFASSCQNTRLPKGGFSLSHRGGFGRFNCGGGSSEDGLFCDGRNGGGKSPIFNGTSLLRSHMSVNQIK